MTPAEYMLLAAKTDHRTQVEIDNMAVRCQEISQLIHYSSGLVTESGELIDVVKKYIAYNKPLDLVNIKEELSDQLWYIARILDLYNWSFEEVMDLNIKKLKARYGDKFTEAAAQNRDLVKERTILEE